VTFGGGLRTTSALTMHDSRFIDNICGDGGSKCRGGAKWSGASATVLNTLFLGNMVTAFGGAIYASSPMTVLNCSYASNAAGQGQGVLNTPTGGTGTVLRNCVAWDNGATPIGGTGTSTVTYSDVQGGYPGAGNLNSDPLFVDAAGGDLSLLEGSPCIDAGNTTVIPLAIDHDLAGAARAVNVTEAPAGVAALGYYADMGAYEFQSRGPTPSCPGDANGDGAVDVQDLVIVVVSWGMCR
jgi:predicted outer membrane repeat protein